MIKFDWRQHEPDAQREPILINRYRDSIEDLSPWRRLVDQLANLSSDLSILSPDVRAIERRSFEELDRFLEDIPNAIPRPSKACVFISHQRKDTAKGVRVACLAEHHRLDSWLDVHDPTLALANQLPASDPRRSILIAAIIEIALLSSTHVIALHTKSSKRSKWVPYELGRAKARKIKSVQAAGWFERRQNVSTCGDYVELAVMAHDEPAIAAWLQMAAQVNSIPFHVPVSVNCSIHKTRPLK